MSKIYQIGLFRWGRGGGGYKTNIFSLIIKGNFPRKTKNNKTIQISFKDSLSISLLSTLMTYAKNISNWPDLGGVKT